MRNSLYPCPFCGSLNLDVFLSFADATANFANNKTADDVMNVQCISCGAQGSSAVGEAQARLRWNRRAGSSIASNSEMLNIIKNIATSNNIQEYKQFKNEARSFLTKFNKESK